VLYDAVRGSQLPLLCNIQTLDGQTPAVPNELVDSFSFIVTSHDAENGAKKGTFRRWCGAIALG
jgi:hypothetical protein